MAQINKLVQASNDEAFLKDVIGTLAVCSGAAIVATVNRMLVKGYRRWWTNLAITYAFIFMYWRKRCHLEPEQVVWGKSFHTGICWKNNTTISGPVDWSQTERYVWGILAVLGIFANVIPKYLGGQEAKRHMAPIGKRFWNPLINHIIAGVLTVLLNGVACVFIRGDALRKFVWLTIPADIYHQITIYRLVRSHDGVWFLRTCSMTLAICKFTCILNLHDKDLLHMTDHIFFNSCAFATTRLVGGLSLVLLPKKFYHEYWYSLGVGLATFVIMFRTWEHHRVFSGLMLINNAAMHFHQLWDKWLQYRDHFVLACVLVTATMIHVPLTEGMILSFSIFVLCFWAPHFKRFSHAPGVTVTDKKGTWTKSHAVKKHIKLEAMKLSGVAGLKKRRKAKKSKLTAKRRLTTKEALARVLCEDEADQQIESSSESECESDSEYDQLPALEESDSEMPEPLHRIESESSFTEFTPTCSTSSLLHHAGHKLCDPSPIRALLIGREASISVSQHNMARFLAMRTPTTCGSRQATPFTRSAVGTPLSVPESLHESLMRNAGWVRRQPTPVPCVRLQPPPAKLPQTPKAMQACPDHPEIKARMSFGLAQASAQRAC